VPKRGRGRRHSIQWVVGRGDSLLEERALWKFSNQLASSNQQLSSGSRNHLGSSLEVSSLGKDMASLKVGDGSGGCGKLEGGQESRGRDRGTSSSARSSGSSARKELKELKRASSKRRSSKQGFLHFLDLAIAN